MVHDYNYVLAHPVTVSNVKIEAGVALPMHDAATLSYDGIVLNIRTTAPSIHLYTGRYNPIYKETRHGEFSGVAFEPVRYLDAINRE